MSKQLTIKNIKKISLIVGLILLLTLLFLVIYFPLSTKNIQFIVFNAVIAMSLTYLSFFIINKSNTANFKYSSIFTATGAFAIFGFSLWYTPKIYINLLKAQNLSFDYTIFVEDSFGQSPSIKDSYIKIYFDNDLRKEKIDEKLSVTFKGIPSNFLNDSSKLVLEAEGWFLRNNSKIQYIKFSGKSSIIEIIQDDSAGYFSGKVLNSQNQSPIINALVSIEENKTSTDSSGFFKLKISNIKLNENYLLNIYKTGYENWSYSVYPTSSRYIQVMLNKK